MKITIEDSNTTATMSAAVANETIPTSTLPALDAGQPPAVLLQAITNAPSIGTTNGMDAGAPPEFLVQALQGSSSMTATASVRGNHANANYLGEITNAGSAPVG